MAADRAAPPPAPPPSGGPARARSVRRALLAATLVVATSAVAAVLLPFWMARHARVRAERCAAAAEAGAELDPAGCLARARAWLFYPRLLPWTRGRAGEEGVLDPAIAARLALDVSTAVRPHAARREAAAAALVATGAATGAPDAPDAGERPRDLALEAGAFEGLFTHGAAGLDRVEVYGALEGALGRGDLAAAERFALALDGAPLRDPSSRAARHYRCSLSTYALLALLGRRKEAQASFAGASCCDGFRCYPDRGRVQWLGYVASGGDLAGLPRQPDAWESQQARLLLALSSATGGTGGAGARPLDEKASWREDSGMARMPFASLAVIQAQPAMEEAIRWFDYWVDRHGSQLSWSLPEAFLRPLQPPWMGLHDGQLLDQIGFVPAALYEQAAARLAALAAAQPDRPAKAAGASPPRPGAASAARAAPRPDDLRWLAWKLRVIAAAEWIHRGQPARARALIAPPPAVDHPSAADRALVPVRFALAAGDPRAALEAVAAVRAREKLAPVHDALLLAYESLAHAALGEWDRALEQARRADDRIWALPTRDLCRTGLHHECLVEGRPEGFASVRVRLRWLRSALAYRLGHREEALAKVPAEIPGDQQPVAGAEALSRVLDVLRLPAGARGPGRLAIGRARAPDLMTAAEMYLVGEAARGDGDVEVWLDRVFSPVMGGGDRAALRARAEAARLRGDAEAAARWEARAHAIEQWIVDDRSATLVRIAGL